MFIEVTEYQGNTRLVNTSYISIIFPCREDGKTVAQLAFVDAGMVQPFLITEESYEEVVAKIMATQAGKVD